MKLLEKKPSIISILIYMKNILILHMELQLKIIDIKIQRAYLRQDYFFWIFTISHTTIALNIDNNRLFQKV